MNARILAVTVLLSASMSILAAAQRVSTDLDVQRLMGVEQFREAGLHKLTPAERAALNRWLNSYTNTVIRLSTSSASASADMSTRSPGSYFGVGSGHWIKEKSDGGGFITLEDGSLWEINSIDRIDTALWLPITNITVIRARSLSVITSTS